MTRVRPCRVSLFVMAAIVLVTALLPALAQSGVAYVYDQLGRLVGVIDPSGNTAAYSYDAVGNLLAITRYSSTQIALVNFSPLNGPVGTTVTISGSGFSTTTSLDTVKFNGTTATVTSATTNSLIVSVPTGATTGQIQVISPAGTVTSSASFTVTADNGAPTITSFSPTTATHGTSITVAGTNISTTLGNDAVSFNLTPQLATSATSTSLSATVPVPASSGHITLSTPSGTAVSSQDLYIPFGTHSASDVGSSARTTIGTASTVSIATSGQIGLVIFDGTAGEIVNLWKTGLSGLSSCNLYVFAPNGTPILHDGVCSSNSTPLPIRLPTTGTYTVGVEPSGTTGSITITVNDASDITGTITAGGSAVTAATTAAGQDARLTFAGTSGQQVYVKISSVTTSDAMVYLVQPDGTIVGSVEIAPTSSGQFYYIDTTILRMNGTYTLWVQHLGSNVGSQQLLVGNAPTPVTGTIAVGGSTVTVTTTTAWQSGELTFSGTAGQSIYLKVTSISTANAIVNLVAPDGTTLEWVGIESASGNWYYLVSPTLPTSGTYTCFIQNDGTDTGSETLELHNVSASSSTTSAGGSPVTVATTPGQEEKLTFSGTSGQRVFLGITAISVQDAFVYLKTSSGAILNSVEISAGTGNSFYLSPNHFADSDTYTISVVQQSGASSGSATLQLYDVTTDITGTISAGGAAVTANTSSPGQEARYTFSGTAGENIFVVGAGTTLQNAYVTLSAPDGSDVGWLFTDTDINPNYQIGSFGTIKLPFTGTYTWWVQNFSLTTGSETLQMYSAPDDVKSTITVGGSPVTATTTALGQGVSLTFSGTAGQQVTTEVDTDVTTEGLGDYFLLDPNGNYLDGTIFGSIFGSPYTWTMGPDTLPVTGTYTIWIPSIVASNPYAGYGSESVKVY